MLESTVVVIRASSFQCQQSKSDDKVNKSRAREDAKQKKRGIVKSFNQEVKTRANKNVQYLSHYYKVTE